VCNFSLQIASNHYIEDGIPGQVLGFCLEDGVIVKAMFEKYASDYACSRPEYPIEIKNLLFEHFSINLDSVIVDIACGSGIFTQMLACRREPYLVAGIDRSHALLAAGIRFYGDFCFEPVCGCGEIIPLKDESCDLITVAQGFHWMHRQRSLSEIVRVLKPGGGIALLWYRRKDMHEPHQAFIEELTHKYNPNYDPKFMDSDYMGMLISDGRFRDLGQRRFYGAKSFDMPTYIKWQRSKSFIGDAMEPDILDDFLREVETGIRQFFPNGVITEEFKYDLIWARKR
jgi:ubiquinone/menaquinone biosynthesis C-methylase UbiE